MRGPDTTALAGWLTRHGQEVTAPLTARRVGAGQSHLTYSVRDALGRQWVLRHPPPGSTAHDVGRESRVLAALADGPVPVPVVIGRRTEPGDAVDAGVEGPFFVMSAAPGAALASEADAASLTPPQRVAVAHEIVSVLAALHTLDPDTLGLGDLAPRSGHLARQLRRTARSWAQWGAQSPADPAWRECSRRFETSMPSAQRTVLVHGDYRLSNVLIDDGRVGAVLDWELCTLGDPLVDLAWLIDDWRSPADPAIAVPSPTRAGGFPDRPAMIGQYARLTGLRVDDLDRYRAFTHWRAATLLQGVLVRRRGGGLGDHGELDPTELETTIAYLLDHALALA